MLLCPCMAVLAAPPSSAASRGPQVYLSSTLVLATYSLAAVLYSLHEAGSPLHPGTPSFVRVIPPLMLAWYTTKGVVASTTVKRLGCPACFPGSTGRCRWSPRTPSTQPFQKPPESPDSCDSRQPGNRLRYRAGRRAPCRT